MVIWYTAHRLWMNTVVLTLYSELDPPVRETVKQITAQIWTIGTSILCYAFEDTEHHPANLLASWKDGSTIFHLVRRNASSPPVPAPGLGDASIGRVYDAGCASGVWFIGNEAVVKVKSWTPGLQSEASTIKFVRENAPSVPLPEVIWYWEDEAANRSFLVMRRVKGRILAEAWPDLSDEQHARIAKDVASHVETLATFTRSRYESVDKCGILENWFMKNIPPSTPYWRRDTLGPFSIPELRAYMTLISTATPPQLNDPFVLFHSDLNAVNIIVRDNDECITILDWESVGFFPRCWIATKCRNFRVENERLSEEDQMGWRDALKRALYIRGFVDCEEEFVTWRKALHQ
ncbi:hypothetical protein HYALB_00013568 [Hymenoscyphus albidus]|uniref:Aminoglycoside phosphotransferase domain-containing protein n=1 Tax=Hymenoscyphus albidus TaxID=595503 RepID=A0A9N9QBY6_9HELO|nr:hypothetical protein HYALB_00013568 [Hymenoscyphus albidus]